jgi:hypothetical protein
VAAPGVTMRKQERNIHWRWAVIGLAACGGYEKTLEVRNTPPSVTIQEPSAGSDFKEAEPIEFVARVGDDADDASDLAMTWSSDVQGVFEDTSIVDDGSGQVIWTTAALDLGTHVIVIEVVDSKGDAAQDSVDIQIIDADVYPEISMVHPTGDESGMEDEEFEFVAQVRDEQDDPEFLRVSFFSDLDGEICDGPEPDLIGVAECDWELSVGEHLLTYTVMDTDGHERSAGPKLFVVGSGLETDDDGDGFTENQNDCDDTDSSIHPGAEEVYNGRDDDCDGIIDEGTEGYDDDGDGWSEIDGDCDDTNPSITYEDCDGDGFISVVHGGDDCDDDDPIIHPDAIEVCDTVDNDCDGQADEEDAVGCTPYYEDIDGDGYGSTTWACVCTPTGDYTSLFSTDCYDGNADANPAYGDWATSHRGDGSFDWNCSGSTETEHGTATGYCECDDIAIFGVCLGSCGFAYGWSGSAPSCGGTGTFYTGCDSGFIEPCDASVESRTQRCR